MNIKYVPLKQIELNPENPRKKLETEDLEKSMKSEGYKANFPITVRPVEKDGQTRYQVIHGNRRLRSAMRVGIMDIPTVVEKLDDRTAFIEAIKENVLRENFNAIEEGEAFLKLRDEYGMNNVKIADMICKTEGYVRNRLDLLSLPPGLRKKVESGELPLRKAEHLSEIGDKEVQEKLAERVIAENMHFDDVKKIVDRLKKVADPRQAEKLIKPAFEDELRQTPLYKAKRASDREKVSDERAASLQLEKYLSDLASWSGLIVATAIEMDSHLNSFDLDGLYKVNQNKRELKGYAKDIAENRKRILKFFDSDMFKKIRGLA